MAIKRLLLLLVLIALAFQSSGCSKLLYYPTRTQYFDPRDVTTNRKDVFFRSQDGTHLHAWYFQAEKPKGLIVFFHGNAQNLTAHFVTLHWALEHGYSLFAFDYRGYGRSQGSPNPKGTYEDGVAAIRWADHRAKKLKIPLYVYGQSLGGAIALKAVADLKSEIPVQGIIADSTFASYQDVGVSVLQKGIITWPFQWLGYLLLSDEYAPEDQISTLTPIPLLVIHGDEDQKVDFKHGKKIFSLASEPKEFWRIPKGRHIDVFWRHEKRYRKKFVSWLKNLEKKD